MNAALILAGGQGTRLGGADKAFLRLQGVPLIEILIRRLGPQLASSLAISANGELARFSACNLPVLADAPEFAGKGPLAGVAAGLAWAKTIGAAALLTVPVDTPFIPPNLLAALSPAPAVACHGARQHHLIALWPVAWLPMLEDYLRAPGPRTARGALALCAARKVAFSGPGEPFLNINTPDDWRAAAQLFGSSHDGAAR